MKPIKCNWDLVSLHWLDAFDGENGWTETKDYKPYRRTVVTVGWLWPNCLEGHVTLVTSYFPDEVPNLKTVGMPTHIPNGMVISQTILKQASILLPPDELTSHESEQKLHARITDSQPSLEKFPHEASRP